MSIRIQFLSMFFNFVYHTKQIKRYSSILFSDFKLEQKLSTIEIKSLRRTSTCTYLDETSKFHEKNTIIMQKHANTKFRIIMNFSNT